jgi:hypothetical protein
MAAWFKFSVLIVSFEVISDQIKDTQVENKGAVIDNKGTRLHVSMKQLNEILPNL